MLILVLAPVDCDEYDGICCKGGNGPSMVNESTEDEFANVQ